MVRTPGVHKGNMNSQDGSMGRFRSKKRLEHLEEDGERRGMMQNIRDKQKMNSKEKPSIRRNVISSGYKATKI